MEDLLLKVSDGRDTPKCEWMLDGEEIKADNEHYKYNIGRNAFELVIPCFESQLKGNYECVVSSAEEPTLSTAVEVIVDSGKHLDPAIESNSLTLYSCGPAPTHSHCVGL